MEPECPETGPSITYKGLLETKSSAITCHFIFSLSACVIYVMYRTQDPVHSMNLKKSNYLTREVGFHCKDGIFTMKIFRNGRTTWNKSSWSTRGSVDFEFHFPRLTKKDMQGLLKKHLDQVMSIVEGRVTRLNSNADFEERLKQALQI